MYFVLLEELFAGDTGKTHPAYHLQVTEEKPRHFQFPSGLLKTKLLLIK